MRWVPDRKVLAGGLGGVITWFIVYLANNYLGWTIPPELQQSLVGLVAIGLAYFVPASIKDLVTKLNDNIVRIAASDPDSDVSERTMVLPKATKVVASSTPGPTVAVPPALAPKPKPQEVDWHDRNKIDP